MLKKVLLFAAALIPLTSCCRIADPAASGISQSIYERSGFEVSWERKAPRCDDLVDCLLQDELTVHAAVQIALLNSPKIQALFEEVGIAQSELINACLIANPIFAAAMRIPEGNFPTYNTEIDALQPLISILLQPIRKKAACLELAATAAHVTSEFFAFIEMVSEAYYNAQAAQLSLEWQRQILEARELEWLVTVKLIEVGNTNELHADVHNDEFQEALRIYESMRIDANTLKMKLAQLMGVFDFEISPAVAMPDEASLSSNDLIEWAYQQRYDLLSLRLQTDAVAKSMGLYQWYAYSDFAAGIAYEREIDSTKKHGPGFALEIPIFNYGQGDRMRVRAIFYQNVQNTRDLCLRIRQEVETVYKGMRLSKEIGDRLESQIIPDKQGIIDQTLRFYNFMNASVFDLLEAKVSELTSEIMLTEARRDYLVYRAQLTRALGGMLP